MKKLFLLATTILLTSNLMAVTVKFTAAEICSGATKSGVTVSSSYSSTSNKQICKVGSQTTKADVVEVKNTASTMNENYVCVSSSSVISSVKIHGCTNSSDSKNIAMLVWKVSAPTDTAAAEQLVNLTGYAGDCSSNVTDVNVPANVKSFKLYRQIKKYDTSVHTVLANGGSNYGDGGTFFVIDLEIEAGPTGPSTDATLKALTYDGTSVSGFAAATTSYDVELSATYTGVPVVAATANDSKATVAVTPATAVPGTASVLVTAEDGTTKKTYTINFTKASNAPKVTTATWSNITAAGAVIDNVNMTITGQVTNGTGLTSITPNFTGNNIQSWSPTTAQNFSAGAVAYTFTSSTGEQTAYNVTITEADPISNDATLKSLTVAGCTLSPAFSPATLSYQVNVSDGTVPQTSAEANHAAATVQITPATSVAGTTKVKVTAEDGVTTKEYQITYKTVVPTSELSIHQPDIYELSKAEGGYGTSLVTYGGREYEVFYSGRTADSEVTIQTTPADKVQGITKDETSTACKAKDDWFKVNIGSIKGTETDPVDEFVTGSGRTFTVNGTSHSIEIHIKGFDQFSLLGYDKKCSDPNKKDQWQILTVTIDGILQEMTPAHQSWTVRRFDISTDEHVIKISGSGSGDNQVGGWSLRCGNDPRVRYIMGNDSSQNIYQTRKLSPVTYIVKNNINTQVVWTSGTPATGISLVKHGTDGVKDTMILEGNANCPVGTYTYRIVAYDAANNEKSSVDKGSFTVGALIKATTDTIVTAYDGWSMDAIEFTYYALDASQIHLTWTGATPGGITGSGAGGTYTIAGTPTAQGTYPYTISVDGGNTITGKIIVEHLELGNNPILYMYKGSTDKDGVLTHLKSKYSVMAATQTSVGNMTDVQKSKFKVIVIGESTDANFEPALNLIRQSTIPVLNMQAFAYNPSRLGWGYASNGSATNGKITVQQPTHPVFKAMAAKAGQEINLLDSVVYRGLVNAEVNHTGSWCLATAAIRGEEYITDAEQQTFLHEVSATERGSKYLCLPIAKSSSLYLSTQGKRLIDECISYLMDGQKSPIALPTLQITRFAIDNVTGVIDEANKIITITMSKGDYSAVVPSITLADATTFVTPASGETVDFSDPYIAHNYVVSDYINKVTYKVYLKQPTALEDVYMPGEWVNIYNMQGMKIMTTNEDVHQLSLPRGVYIIQTSTQSFRIFK